MYYVYVLLLKNDQLYIGSTSDLRSRIQKHKEGKVFTTAKYLPFTLVYYEAYVSKEDAQEREQKLKQFGSAYVGLKRRMKRSILARRRRRG